MIPCTQLLDGHAEAIGDGYQGVVAAHGVAFTGCEAAAGCDRDNEFIAGLDGVGEVIDGGDLSGVGVQRLGDLVEGLTALHDVETPGGAIFLGNVLEARGEDVASAGGKMKIVGNVVGCGEAEERGVECHDLGESGVGEVGDEAHVDGVAGGDVVGEDGRVGHDVGEAVLLGIFCHDGGGDDAGDVGLGFGGETTETIDLPVVGIAGFRDGVLHAARAPVVGGHGEVPVTELVIEGLHVLGVGEGGLFGVEALVEVAVAHQPVAGGEGHELPHACGAGFAIDGLGLEAGLGDGLVDEVLGERLARCRMDSGSCPVVFAGAFRRLLTRCACSAGRLVKALIQPAT